MRNAAFGIGLLALTAWSAPARADGFPGLRGPYLGQPPPGDRPEVFAPGIVSTGRDELNSVFSPDGDLFLFCVKLPRERRHTLMIMSRAESGWTEPQVAPFSGLHSDADPAFGPDGRHLYFISTRPAPGGPAGDDWNLWTVDRNGAGWGEPRLLPPPVNSEEMEIHPSIARDGTLYFSSARPGGCGRNDLYRAEPLAGGGYAPPENLGPVVNSEGGEGDLFVAPDEGYLVFVSGRPGQLGGGDLYCSHRAADGGWSRPRNLGPAVNSTATEYCPAVSPDGRWLFFTSYRLAPDHAAGPLTRERIEDIYDRPRNGLGDVFWMSAAVIDDLRPPAADACADRLLALHGGPAPGATPEIFAPGRVSTDAQELDAVVAPAGDGFWFARQLDAGRFAIMTTRSVDGIWATPRVEEFSGRHSDVDPCLSPDGRRLLFGSGRPGGLGESDLWVVDRAAEGWSIPRPAAGPVNTGGNENYPSLTDAGVLVFHSDGHGGFGGLDLLSALPDADGGWQAPVNLGPAVNTAGEEFDAFIAPDASYLVYSSRGRRDGQGGGDLYVSFRAPDGGWSEARNLAVLNSPSIDYCPRVSPDGRWLFFSSGRSGSGDVYWADWEAVLATVR